MELYVGVLAETPDITEVVKAEEIRGMKVYFRFGSERMYRKKDFSSLDGFLDLLADDVYRVNHNDGSTYEVANRINLIICTFAKTFGLPTCLGCGEKHESGECEGITDDPDSRWETDTNR